MKQDDPPLLGRHEGNFTGSLLKARLRVLRARAQAERLAKDKSVEKPE